MHIQKKEVTSEELNKANAYKKLKATLYSRPLGCAILTTVLATRCFVLVHSYLHVEA